ncbi:hypothetical protein SAMN05519103_00712 [Rhizobiales bacterium GAS113]|nr:hypothetical protein SAMN05519103_00712 [Rhizobiales bacterium GAS113]
MEHPNSSSFTEAPEPVEAPHFSVKAREDGWFDRWMCASGEPLKRLVSGMIAGLDFHEQQTRPRTRARKGQDRRRYEATIEVVVANLARAVLVPPASGRIAHIRSKATKKTRYDNPDLSPKVIPQLLELMQTVEMIEQTIGRRGDASTITPTPWFASQVSQAHVTLADFGRREGEEVVILNKVTKRLAPWQESLWERDVESVDYEDTEVSRRFRRDVQALNEFLAKADLDFIDDGEEPKVDPYQRTLWRYFSHRPSEGAAPFEFDKNGRLFGAWWTNLKKHRRQRIRIDGEPAAILDYASMFGRLAYAELGATPPPSDLYDLTGHLDGYDTEKHRDAVKKVFNSLLFGQGRKLPAGLKAGLPPKATMAKVRKAIVSRHPDLAEVLGGTGIGYSLMFQESEVLMECLKQLMKEGIVGLGLHDGLMVAQSKAARAKAIMEDASLKVTGAAIPVSLKETPGP